MKENRNKSELLEYQLLRILLPGNILKSFDISEIDEYSETIIINFTEKKEHVPDSIGCSLLVFNGYMNWTELQHFPISGKALYLRVRRRRWKDKLTGKESYFNHYNFCVSGTKATKEFGDFLKESGQSTSISTQGN